MVQYDRDTAARFGISPQLIDNVLYDAFGQRQVSTMYTALNQYHVVMEAAPQILAGSRSSCARSMCALRRARTVPLERHRPLRVLVAPLAVNHQGLFPAVTISFNLAPGVALGDAVDAIEATARKVGLPAHHPNRLCRNRAGLSGLAAAMSLS